MIDKQNGNTLWMDAIKLEMKNAHIAFKEYDGNPEELIGYKQITGNLIYWERIFGEKLDSSLMDTKWKHQHP